MNRCRLSLRPRSRDFHSRNARALAGDHNEISMTLKRVLDIGQCDLDHSQLKRLFEQKFSAQVERAHGWSDAETKLHAANFDLILVNRILDRDGSEGLGIVRALKSDPALAAMPVMLVSNYASAQQAALAAGAEPGFGKSQLQSSETLAKLTKLLA